MKDKPLPGRITGKDIFTGKGKAEWGDEQTSFLYFFHINFQDTQIIYTIEFPSLIWQICTRAQALFMNTYVNFQKRYNYLTPVESELETENCRVCWLRVV